VIAARDAGCDVVGSYEDDGYGLDAQRLNFPDLSYAGRRQHWPDDDLRGVVVIAHPPCAGFSTQNRTANRGTASTAFKQTEEVLDYALSRDADAVLVESVVPTMAGAAAIHDVFARHYGYRLYRVLQNAVTFGVPQWRPRFWAVFVREGLLPARVWFHHEPHRRTIADILTDGGRPIRAVAGLIDRQRAAIRAEYGDAEAAALLNGDRGCGRLPKVIARRLGIRQMDAETMKRVCLSTFSTNHVRILDPNGTAPVLLHYAQWVCRGRPLSRLEYQRVMGYPDDYRFPRDDTRTLLSKGVCPPVAAWLLDQVLAWIEQRTPPLLGIAWAEPGSIVDLQPRRRSAIAA
jgi:site-specific DNA-cytosine methylase